MISKTLELHENEIRALLLEYKQTYSSKTKNKIVKSYLNLVQKIAKSYSNKDKSCLDDLVQVGCIGLIHAIDKFDLNQKVSFKTYSTHFIAGEMKHYIRDYSSPVKLPRDLQELLPKIIRTKQFLSLKNNKEPTSTEIGNYLGIESDKVDQVLEMQKISNFLSLDQQISGTDTPDAHDVMQFIHQLEDKKYSSFQLVQEDRIILNEAITSIKEQSRQVLEYTFYHDLSQTEIAKKMGISQMQVSRKLKGAVKELWEILNTRVTPW